MKIEELAALVSPQPVIAGSLDLADLDSLAGFALPNDYRSFLQISGGGGTLRLNDLEYVEFRKGKFAYYPQIFCRPSGSDYHSVRPLGAHLADIEKDVEGVPEGIFTIAEDGAGNFLSIDLRANSFGHIGVVDHETADGGFGDAETYRLIAESFSDLVKRCRMRREVRVIIVGNDAPVEILNLSEAAPLLAEASRRNATARLCDDTSDWIEFQPVRGGGHVYRTFTGSPGRWQCYYPPSKNGAQLAGLDATIIEFDDVVTLFGEFLSKRASDLDIRCKHLV